MSNIRYIKIIPKPIQEFFNIKYPEKKGFSYEFYSYKGDTKYYGCFVRYNGELYSYSDQNSLIGFKDALKDVKEHKPN